MALSPPVFVGRQPVYDRDLNVAAYELLFRGTADNEARVVDPEQATSELIVSTFLDIGLRNLVGDKPAFINVTRDYILGGHLAALAGHRLGLEVLEDTPVDEALLRALAALRSRGHLILLDDFVYHEQLEPLVAVADIVKLDVLALPGEALAAHVARLRARPLKLLAEKIETPEMYARCRALDFDYYQGFFFCRPNVVRGERASAGQAAVMRLLAAVLAPGLGLDALARVVNDDVGLSYRLLRLVNAAGHGLARHVGSIQEALVVLGAPALRNWIALIALSRVGGKPHELLVTGLLRARMCEALADGLGRRDCEAFFTTGLLSVLDALMDRPLAELLAELPLADAPRRALLEGAGVMGQVLACVLAYERGEWARVQCPGLDKGRLPAAYLEALEWADTVGAQLRAP